MRGALSVALQMEKNENSNIQTFLIFQWRFRGCSLFSQNSNFSVTCLSRVELLKTENCETFFRIELYGIENDNI